jgi:uncharacterized protein YcbK (DUF882 family)
MVCGRFVRFFAPAPLAAALALAAVAVSGRAGADTTHIVQRGHTLEAIAHRYHVSVKAIIEANQLLDPRNLRPGQSLVIPGVAPGRSTPTRDAKADGRDRVGEAAAGARAPTASFERGPLRRGRSERDSVHAVRMGQDYRIRVKDGHGHVPANALKTFEQLMRQGNAIHPVDSRLLALLGIVSNHFEGRPLEVVSGYRAYTTAQYTPHSNHNFGRAIDFRVRGVPNEELRDFCRTLRNTGCGYYPNSTFVHLDVRDTSAYWVDWSHAGDPPQYDKPGIAADEGASDVPDETSTAYDVLPELPPAPASSPESSASLPAAVPRSSGAAPAPADEGSE